MDVLKMALLGMVVFMAYMAPALVAAARSHHNFAAITTLNLLLGWTLLGWVGAMVWAFTRVLPPHPVNAEAFQPGQRHSRSVPPSPPRYD